MSKIRFEWDERKAVTNIHSGCNMREEYDFSKSRKNPYAAQLKKQITIRIDEDAIAYFKGISEELGLPYQSLINLYLRDCATSHRRLDLSWKETPEPEAGR